MKTFKSIPEFKNELEEFEFWSKADSMDYIDWDEAKSKHTTTILRITFHKDLR